jgi:hypothetical protein
VLGAVRVKVVLVAEGLGEKLPVTPLGNPEMEKVTWPLNPDIG